MLVEITDIKPAGFDCVTEDGKRLYVEFHPSSSVYRYKVAYPENPGFGVFLKHSWDVMSFLRHTTDPEFEAVFKLVDLFSEPTATRWLTHILINGIESGIPGILSGVVKSTSRTKGFSALRSTEELITKFGSLNPKYSEVVARTLNSLKKMGISRISSSLRNKHLLEA